MPYGITLFEWAVQVSNQRPLPCEGRPIENPDLFICSHLLMVTEIIGGKDFLLF